MENSDFVNHLRHLTPYQSNLYQLVADLHHHQQTSTRLGVAGRPVSAPPATDWNRTSNSLSSQLIASRRRRHRLRAIVLWECEQRGRSASVKSWRFGSVNISDDWLESQPLVRATYEVMENYLEATNYRRSSNNRSPATADFDLQDRSKL